MRGLPDSLLTAQKSPSAVPYVQVQIRERIGNVARLAWERLYSGGESDYFHAATMPGDGSLIRARVEPSTGQLYLQRVDTPGPGKDFASWAFYATVSSTAGIALASDGANVLLFYVETDNVTIKLIQSTDHGATFGSPTTVATAAGAVGWLAADLKSNGTALLIYSVGATVYRVKRSGGVWGSPAAWSNSLASVAGLACCYAIDFNVVVAGSDASGATGVWTAVYGDGFNQPLDTWSGLTELARADAGSDVEFRAPFLDRADTYRMLFVERFNGNQPYSRPFWTHVSVLGDFVSHSWREPVPFNISSGYGMAIAHSQTAVWLSTPFGVWRAPFGAPALDVSEDVLEVREECAFLDGRLRLLLRNDDGRYSDLTSGSLTVIKRGSQVDMSPGYVTAEGPLVSAGSRYWIEGWEYSSGRGGAAFVLHARDGWSLLERWRARREYAWTAGAASVFQLLSFIFARAGLEFVCRSSSTTLTSFRPAFAVHPGEDGRAAVQRLLQMVPDVVQMAGETGMGLNPLPDQEADCGYGGDHVILSGRYGTGALDFNRVQVFGQGRMLDAFDWESIDDVYDRLRQVQDLNLATADQLQQRVDALMRRAAMSSLDGEITVPVNCGQELYDVVTVTDPAAGLSEARRRVLGISLHYSRAGAAPLYQMRLRLGAV
jgi:hypothetical protein